MNVSTHVSRGSTEDIVRDLLPALRETATAIEADLRVRPDRPDAPSGRVRLRVSAAACRCSSRPGSARRRRGGHVAQLGQLQLGLERSPRWRCSIEVIHQEKWVARHTRRSAVSE